MIAGVDVTFDVHALVSSPAVALYACLQHWPDAVYQNANEEDGFPVREAILRARSLDRGDEFFVYRDRASFDSWARDGASPANEDAMIHFIYADPPVPTVPFFKLTMVSDRRSEVIQAIEEKVRLFAANPYAMIGAPTFVPEPVRMHTKHFKYVVLETYALFFPKMSTVDIVFNPRVAIQLCDLVRMRIGEPVPDPLIMQTLFIEYQDVLRKRDVKP